jgi:hypothetical protein
MKWLLPVSRDGKPLAHAQILALSEILVETRIQKKLGHLNNMIGEHRSVVRTHRTSGGWSNDRFSN